MLESDKGRSEEGIEQLVKNLNECEKSLHSANSEKDRLIMDMEKERLRFSQIDFHLKDMQQKFDLKDQEVDKLMKEKISLSHELKDVSQEKLDLITKYQKGLIPELGDVKDTNIKLKDQVSYLEKELKTSQLTNLDLMKERENNNEILNIGQDENENLKKILNIGQDENENLKKLLEEITSGQVDQINSLTNTRLKEYDDFERDKSI